MSEPSVDPTHCALLVMDYQPVVLNSLPGAAELLEHTRQAVTAVRRHGGHIGYVRVAFQDEDYSAVPPANQAFAAVAAARYLSDASADTAIHHDVAPEPGDIVVRKTRVGAFSTTDLDAQLRGRGVQTLILAGVHTSGVVLSTVREAADRDYRLIVLEDCAADPDAEVHDVLLRKVLSRQATVTTAGNLAALFAAAR